MTDSKQGPSAGDTEPPVVKESIPEEGVGIDNQLEGLQAKLDVKKETREDLQENMVGNFFEGIFGKGKISLFLTYTLSKIGLGPSDMDWDDFKEDINTGKEKAGETPVNLKEFIVAHRSLGYGRGLKENSLGAIESCLTHGEEQLEFDVRRGKDGELYLSHDSITDVDPEDLGEYTTLRDGLELIAQYPKADVFLDLKDSDLIGDIDTMIDEIDEEKSKTIEGYSSIAKRHFVMGWEPSLVTRSKERRSERPVMFSYLPSGGLDGLDETMSSMGTFGMGMVAGVIDLFTGSNFKEELNKTNMVINGKSVSGTNKEGENNLHVYKGLPPQEILDKIEYIVIPASLATPALIEQAHAAKNEDGEQIKVALYGVRGIEVQQVIANGADLIITDYGAEIEEEAGLSEESPETPEQEEDPSE